jgi:hypothetical protein
MTSDVNRGGQSINDTIELLDNVLAETAMHANDSEALRHALNKMTDFVDVSLPKLLSTDIGVDEKARLVHLRESIVGLEKTLGNRQRILAAFSVHFREMVEG